MPSLRLSSFFSLHHFTPPFQRRQMRRVPSHRDQTSYEQGLPLSPKSREESSQAEYKDRRERGGGGRGIERVRERLSVTYYSTRRDVSPKSRETKLISALLSGTTQHSFIHTRTYATILRTGLPGPFPHYTNGLMDKSKYGLIF